MKLQAFLIAILTLSPVAYSCCCQLYEHCDYKGTRTCIDASNAWIGWSRNDRFSSIKVGQNCECTVFQHSRYGGKKWTITRSTADSVRKCFVKAVMEKRVSVKIVTWNDQISSVQVKKIKQHCAQTSWKCGDCNKKNGIMTCTRQTTKKALHGGKACGANTMTKKCRVNCEVGEFGGFGGCSKNCGGGIKSRRRHITVHPKNGGNKCPGLFEHQRCNTDRCPCCATFYQHCWFNSRGNDRRGWKFRSCGSSPWIGRHKNDNLSSLHIDKGCKVILYEHAHYKGKALTLTRDTQCLTSHTKSRHRVLWWWVTHSWNDQVSSWRVKHAAAIQIVPMTDEEMAQAQQEETSYASYAVFGVLGVGLVGAFAYKKRQQNAVEYESLVNAEV